MNRRIVIHMLSVFIFFINFLFLISVAAIAAQGDTIRVSVDSLGNGGIDFSYSPSISSDGRYVAFGSAASDLVTGDTNGWYDIFVHDTQTGITTRVSVDSSGGEADGNSYPPPSISSDGRYVAFESEATNLVPGDTNGFWDIYIHDTQTGETTRVSVDSSGGESDGFSDSPSISSDGRYVAFESEATNLVPGDTNDRADIFVHDTQTGVTTRVSVDSSGGENGGTSFIPSISSDGRYVAFFAGGSGLVPDDTNGWYDIFVHDTQTGITTRVSVDSSGGEANAWSRHPSISSDGRYVAFNSEANNLVPGDTNGVFDIFVHDTQTGITTRVSVDSSGSEANGDSNWTTTISSDGRYIAFESEATNLVPGDTNGSSDIFVHDTQTGETTRVSVDSSAGESDGNSYTPSISSDGSYVAFQSFATNLVANDTGGPDIFVHQFLGNVFVNGGSSNGWCFIATAAYGSFWEPHVMTLRQFRDSYLLTNKVGTRFMEIYYKYSPQMADYISEHDNLRSATRIGLAPLVGFSWLAVNYGVIIALAVLFSILGLMIGSTCLLVNKRKAN